MSVETKSDLAKIHERELSMVETLWGGTYAMRDAGVKYLPREAKEHEDDYENRKNRSTLTNFFKKTIKSQSGKVCSQEIKVVGDEKAEELAENIDFQGRDLHRFTHSLSQKTIRDGVRLILIDAPNQSEIEAQGLEPQEIRPYWVEIDRSAIIDWKEIDGQLSHIRIKEVVYEDKDDFSQEKIDQIRVLDPGLVTIYRKVKDSWEVHDSFVTTFKYIPVVPVYSGSPEMPLVCEPPLMDLAHLNIEHWQKSSDHSNILHVSSIAHLFVKGVDAGQKADGSEKTITFGPNGLTQTSNTDADMKFVEHTGAASGAVSENIKALEDNARATGADFATPKPGVMTATQRVIEEGGNLSELSAFSLSLKDSLESAFVITMDMLGKKFTGSVQVRIDFKEYSMDFTAKDLLDARVSSAIDQETYLKSLSERTGIEINIPDVMKSLKSEFDEEITSLDSPG